MKKLIYAIVALREDLISNLNMLQQEIVEI